MANDAGRVGDSVPLVPVKTFPVDCTQDKVSVSDTGGAECMENNDPAVLYSVNSAISVAMAADCGTCDKSACDSCLVHNIDDCGSFLNSNGSLDCDDKYGISAGPLERYIEPRSSYIYI